MMPLSTDNARLELFYTAPLEATGNKPLYRMVEDHIRGLINTGHLIPGDLIPSESQLANALNVSPGTIKKAITNLVWEQLLFRHQGKGTYVSRVDFESSLFRFFSYGDAEGRSIRIKKETTARSLQPGPVAICKRLNIDDGSELVYIERLGFINKTPILIEYSWWPATIVPGLEDEKIHIPDYLYALVLNRYGVPIVRAEETLTAEAADSKTAKMLNIEKDTPVVVLKRITYTRNDKIVEVRTTKGRADRFSYKTEIR